MKNCNFRWLNDYYSIIKPYKIQDDLKKGIIKNNKRGWQNNIMNQAWGDSIFILIRNYPKKD